MEIKLRNEAMYERPRVHVKVEPRSTFTFTRGHLYIASILFTRVKFKKIRDSGILPLLMVGVTCQSPMRSLWTCPLNFYSGLAVFIRLFITVLFYNEAVLRIRHVNLGEEIRSTIPPF